MEQGKRLTGSRKILTHSQIGFGDLMRAARRPLRADCDRAKAFAAGIKDANNSWHNRGKANHMKNFRLPLPEETYTRLRAEAERAQAPATALARDAIDWWLRQQLRKTRHDALAAYAAEMAGTDFDLDPDLEAAGIEHMIKNGKTKK